MIKLELDEVDVGLMITALLAQASTMHSPYQDELRTQLKDLVDKIDTQRRRRG